MKKFLGGAIAVLVLALWVALCAAGVISIKMEVGIPLCFAAGMGAGAVAALIWITS